MSTRDLTQKECVERAAELAVEIRTGFYRGHIHVYGVPRGGIYAAQLVVNYQVGDSIKITEDPTLADFIIDDLVDSGATRDKFQNLYPYAAFEVLFEKGKDLPASQWVTFPWERARGDTGDTDDIFTRLLQFVGEDTARGGLAETPSRAAKAWQFWTSGYDKDPADVLKVFEDGAESCDEIVLVKNIPLYSHCEHHLASIFGKAHVGYIPNGKIVGLSKINRVVDLYARRLQVQERLTNQIADALWKHLEPHAVGVVLDCRHMCMESRGVCQQGHSTVTSALRGAFREDATSRGEFLQLVNNA